ncbi:hypothetical protein GCM10023322_59440 [Rugosimonospora acidiphila]|uniref:DUF3618 domain-containing protein n=1 Tax=Rugosimonospora acidiphila TaxID=556531 RepID=A0ABP9SH03_9ACTN
MSDLVRTGKLVGGAADNEALRRRIEQTRQELAETVGALAAKADIKARLTTRMHRAGVRIDRRSRRLALVLAGGAVLLIGISVAVSRGRAPAAPARRRRR